jgi:hypothetical protein
MFAIVMALKSVRRVFSTTSQPAFALESNLLRIEQLLLRELEDVVNPLDEYRNYHEALHKIKSPLVIPWLGTCLLCPSPSPRIVV